MKLKFSTICGWICSFGVASLFLAYFEKRREKKLMQRSFNGLMDSYQARLAMDRRVNFYHNEYEQEMESE